MRIVLDTNVVVSALLWRGTPHDLLQAILVRKDVRVFTSEALLKELGDVLKRPVLAKQLALIGRAPEAVLADFIQVVELVEVREVPPVVQTDADDDQVIATAVAAQAELLVSGDRDLLALGGHGGCTICMAADALRRMNAPRAEPA